MPFLNFDWNTGYPDVPDFPQYWNSSGIVPELSHNLYLTNIHAILSFISHLYHRHRVVCVQETCK